LCAEIIGKGCRFELDKDVDAGDSGEGTKEPEQDSAEVGGDSASYEGVDGASGGSE
jgi:hypothetical protein